MTQKAINSGLLVTLGLPLFAIVASLGTAVVAFTRGDPTLPDDYHWEGMSLDRDFAHARHAEQLRVRATLEVLPSSGICRVSLRQDGVPPLELALKLVHATRPDLDRLVHLTRAGSGYEGQCGPVPPGHWHLELSDAAGSWSVRQDVLGVVDGTSVDATREPTGPGVS